MKSFMMFQFIIIIIIVFIENVYCENYNLSVIHFNDFHARYEPVTNTSTVCRGEICIGGFSRLYFAIMMLLRERSPSLLLNAGDNFKGTLWYNVHKWNVTQYFLNKLPFDAITLGNHEFDDGISALIPFLKSIHTSIVVANIDDRKEPSFQNLYNKSIIIEKGGRRIGIIGVISTTTNKVSHTGNLIFLNESISVNLEAKKLEKDGVFTIVVLSHCGYTVDLDIARKSNSKISLIVGGHTDTFLFTGIPAPGPDKPSGPYPTVVLNKNGNKVLIVQASAYTKYLGNITVVYNKYYGNVTDWHGAPIFLDNSIPTETSIDEELKLWKTGVDLEGNRVVGNTLFTMPNQPCRSEECILGNFATDAMIAHYSLETNDISKRAPIIAIIHGGGMRAGIKQGNITVSDLVSTFPFGDMIDSFDIKGIHLKDIFESHIDNWHLKSPHLFQVSGLRIIFNVTNPEGQRVQFLQVLLKSYNISSYEDINLSEDYKILLPTFLSASDFNPLFKKYLKNNKNGKQDLEIYSKYLQDKCPLSQQIEKRIRIVN